MSFLEDLGRVASGIATLGGSEIARVAAHAAGAPKHLIRKAGAIVGASTIGALEGGATGFLTGGPKGALVGLIAGAGNVTVREAIALAKAGGPVAALRSVTPRRRAPAPQTSFEPLTFQGLNPTAFVNLTPFSPTGGNPSWRYLERQAGSFLPR
jgi:hypothetical protein